MSLKRFSDLNNPEILWRRARSEWEIIKLSGGKETVEELKATLDLVDRALQIDDNNSNAHRWKAIISNGYAEKLGLKPQFGNLETMKYHLNRALELDPQDSTACTLLGVWHMELQGLSWLQRKVAATFLGAVPQTSYEEALVFLLRAEEVAPKAWNRNLFLIAKVYLAYVSFYIACVKVYLAYVKVYLAYVTFYLAYVKVYLAYVEVYLAYVTFYLAYIKVYLAYVKVYLAYVKVYLVYVKVYLAYVKVYQAYVVFYHI